MLHKKTRTEQFQIYIALISGLCALVLYFGLSGAALAQTTSQEAADTSLRKAYERAKRLLPQNGVYELIDGEDAIVPNWIGESDDFWYQRDEGPQKSIIRVNGHSGVKEIAFDHQAIAVALAKASGQEISAETSPFGSLTLAPDGSAVKLTLEGTEWNCRIDPPICKKTGDVNLPPASASSEDGRWHVFTENFDLYAYDSQRKATRALTDDGVEGQAYASYAGLTVPPAPEDTPPAVYFSPDSKRILTFKLDYRSVPLLHLQDAPIGKRPTLYSYPFSMPGDPVPVAQWVIFDLETGSRTDVQMPPMPIRPNDQIQAQWSDTGNTAFFVREEPGYQRAYIHAVDGSSGEVRIIHEEKSKTSNYRFPVLKAVGDGSRVLWTSERDGWNHLYLVQNGKRKSARQLTRGKWVVRDVSHVDEDNGWIYFLASGRERGRDPYYHHLYRIRFDGSDLELLTPEDADHEVTFAPSSNVFVDTYSRVDQAPVTVLRKASGELIAEIEKAEVDRLLAAGWRYPERFTVKARDGSTDLYGVIFRPSTFDPDKSYPVIDIIYPGPQTNGVPKSFNVYAAHAQATAELGFIVVMVDGMGTPFRSKAFREVSYGELLTEAGGVEDHVVALKQLGKRFPEMDLSRVGISGHSGGGYASVRALLAFPDFFKVAVSSAGNHDQLLYHAGWGERYQGYPDGDNYDGQRNSDYVQNLKGQLLLIQGAMDDNVHISHTFALVQALVDHNKDFDLLIVPDGGHRVHRHPYVIRRRWDYFVEHLLKRKPPLEFDLSSSVGER